MNAQVIDQWASQLQRALSAENGGASSRSRRLSRSAAQLEARALLSVVHGIRCATLISAFATNHANVAALSALLQRHSEEVFVLVHVASEQTFVVHRGTLCQRLGSDGDVKCVDTVFIPVDQSIVSKDVETRMPEHLAAMLRAIRETLSGSGCKAPVILLHGKSDEGHGRAVAVAGVALAGCLLEYPVAYYLRSARCHQASAQSVHEIGALQNILPLDHSFDVDDITSNNLGGKPLTLFSRWLEERLLPCVCKYMKLLTLHVNLRAASQSAFATSTALYCYQTLLHKSTLRNAQ